MTRGATWHPTREDPLLMLAMDHRGSFGSTLFGVQDDAPTPEQAAAMRAAKDLIFRGLREAVGRLPRGTAGVLVDEQYGQAVVDAAVADDAVALALPVEASGHAWFTLQYGDRWYDHVDRVRPDFVKVLVRDNPELDPARRRDQLAALAAVSAALAGHGVALLLELLVPATPEQSAAVSGDALRYDTELRPGLVSRVIADSQAAGVEPQVWKVEGLETLEAAQEVAAQACTGGRDTRLVVLGRDAPADRLHRWLEVAAQVEAFVGFAIGRSIWQDAVRSWREGSTDDDGAAAQVAGRYLDFAHHYLDAGRP